MNWGVVSTDQKLSEDFIIEFKDKLNWKRLPRNQKLSPEFIYLHMHKFNMESLLRCKGNILKEQLKEAEEKETIHSRFDLIDL